MLVNTRELPRAPREHIPHIPRCVSDLCQQCLSPRREDRPQSAKDLVEAIRGAERRVRWHRLRPAIVVLTVLSLMGVIWGQYRQRNPRVEVFTYRGRITYETGAPAAGTSVSIDDELGVLSGVNEKKTLAPINVGEDGSFALSVRALSESSFKLVFEKPGYCREVQWASVPSTGQVMAFELRREPCEDGANVRPR
jgi:hypothetical protein